MYDFILLMHNDATEPQASEQWAAYFAELRSHGAFQGGSAIGAGATFRKSGDPARPCHPLAGYIRVRASDIRAARALIERNPVYLAGGTVEIRELPAE